MDLELFWMIYYAETAFIFCLVQLLNAKLASSVWHVWQTPLWSVHPTGCKGPAGSAHSSQHYLLLILLPCMGVLWHPWERWAHTGWWKLGRRGQGEAAQSTSHYSASQYGPWWCFSSVSHSVNTQTPALSSGKLKATCTQGAFVKQVFWMQVPSALTASPHVA